MKEPAKQRPRCETYGEAIGWGRARLRSHGVLAPWELVAEGHDGKHVLDRLRKSGEAVAVHGSTLHARPDVAAAIEAAIASAVARPTELKGHGA